MAIPEGRMSTVPVPGTYSPPENRVVYANISYERGPVAIEDTSLGLLYQNWMFMWEPSSANITATPETAGTVQTIANIPGLVSLSATFDQNGRVSYTYTTAVSSYMYWYDTALGYTVTTDLGADVITPALQLDDKRATQNNANDMLLWYTKANGDKFDLYRRKQRERFLIEHLSQAGIDYAYIHNIGMHDALRVQLTIKQNRPRIPYV